MDNLPCEIIFTILNKLDIYDIANFSMINWYYHNICQDVYFWSNHVKNYTKYSPAMFKELQNDIKKYNNGVTTADNIFTEIIKNNANHADSPKTEYGYFLFQIYSDLNIMGSKIVIYLEKAVSSIIWLYHLLEIKSKYTGECQHKIIRGYLKGFYCYKSIPFMTTYCDMHKSRH